VAGYMARRSPIPVLTGPDVEYHNFVDVTGIVTKLPSKGEAHLPVLPLTVRLHSEGTLTAGCHSKMKFLIFIAPPPKCIHNVKRKNVAKFRCIQIICVAQQLQSLHKFLILILP